MNAKSGKNILVVDDEPDICELLRTILTGAGYSTRTTENAQEFMSQLEEDRADLLVVDLMMPEMDGFSLIQRIRENEAWKKIPVLVVTALTRDSKRSDEFWAEELDVRSFVTKPFDSERLLDEVSRILS